MSRITFDISLERLVRKKYEEKKCQQKRYQDLQSIQEAIGVVKKLDYYSLSSLVVDAEEEYHREDIASSTPEYHLSREEQPLAYQPRHYEEINTSPPIFASEEEEYYPPAKGTERELSTVEEAREAFMEVQYAAVLQSPGEVNHEQRRKLQWWIWFNPIEFRLLESTYALTRDVNYAPVG